MKPGDLIKVKDTEIHSHGPSLPLEAVEIGIILDIEYIEKSMTEKVTVLYPSTGKIIKWLGKQIKKIGDGNG